MKTLAEWIEVSERERAKRRCSANNFAVGQKIVCINDSWYPSDKIWVAGEGWRGCVPAENYPQMGKIYTVRIVCPDLMPDNRWHENIQVDEIWNPNRHPEMGIVGEPWWWEGNFRPLVLRKTDITIFKKILEDA